VSSTPTGGGNSGGKTSGNANNNGKTAKGKSNDPKASDGESRYGFAFPTFVSNDPFGKRVLRQR
jgi:hypothetical protein